MDATALTADPRYFAALQRLIVTGRGSSKYGRTSSAAEMGAALKGIRDERLYREKYRTFEEYCAFEWAMLPAEVERLINRTATPRPAPPAVSVRKLPTACVYFVQCGEHPLVKIGFASDLTQRLASLQIGCPFLLRLIGRIDGATPQDEYAIHRAFSHLRTRGEWFRLTKDVFDYIARRATGGVDA
jgi:hypothetical protein